MYGFRKLKGRYEVRVTVVSPQRKESTYRAEIALSATFRNMTDDYLFEIESREGVMLNGQTPSGLPDMMMFRLSSACYPIRLLSAPDGTISSLVNGNEIRERWEAEAAQVRSQSNACAKYVVVARENVESPDAFLRALRRDSFIQMYFLGWAERLSVECYNFPRPGESTLYDLTADQMGRMVALGDRQAGTLHREFSETNDLIRLDAEFVYDTLEGRYLKKINIENRRREAKASSKFKSFLFD